MNCMKSIVSFNIITNQSKTTANTITVVPIIAATDGYVNKNNILECLRANEDIMSTCNDNIMTLSDWIRATLTGRIIHTKDNSYENFTLPVNDVYALNIERVRCALNNIINHTGDSIHEPLSQINIGHVDDETRLRLVRTLNVLKIKERYPEFYSKCARKLNISQN